MRPRWRLPIHYEPVACSAKIPQQHREAINGHAGPYNVLVDNGAQLRYGERLYWCCPGCGRRVSVLYLLGATFRCRRCHWLTYRSSQESDGRVSRLLAELTANPALLDDLLSNARTLNPTTLLVLLKAQERLYERAQSFL